MLRSEGHQIYGLHVNKISLSPLDTKRWIDAEDTLHIHYTYTLIH